MRNNKDVVVKQRVMRITLEHADLVKLISQEARASFAPSTVGNSDPSYEIKIRQLEEGSPSYKVSKLEADVTITENF